MKTIFTFLLVIILFTNQLSANNNIEDIAIENVEFPQLVSIGDIVMFKCDIVNTSAVPVTLDFDLNFNITTTNNDFSEIDETETIENEILEPGERRSVERPIYINNARAASNSNNLVATWPAARNGNEERGAATETDFYVEDEEEDLNRDPETYDVCNVEIIEQNGQIIIEGLSPNFETSVINQNGVIEFYCNGNCEEVQVIDDLPESGFFLVQVKSITGQLCFSFNTVTIGDPNQYQFEYDINDIFYIPSGFLYDLESALQQNINDKQQDLVNKQQDLTDTQLDINLAQQDIDYIQQKLEAKQQEIVAIDQELIAIQNGMNNVQNPILVMNNLQIEKANLQIEVFNLQVERTNLQIAMNNLQIAINNLQYQNDYLNAGIDYLQSIIDSIKDATTVPNCIYPELEHVPQIEDIFETTALISISELYNNVNCEIKESESNEWVALAVSEGIAVLNQLKACTKYDIRNTYTCNFGKVVSDIVTFETEGCENTCDRNNIKLYQLASFSNGVVLNWDFLPGKAYKLEYKIIDQIEWNTYNTISPIALLFGLELCSTYEFKVSTECENNLLSIESNAIIFETGNCKLSSDLFIDEELVVYPTIATNYIGIVLNDTEDISQLSIYDLAGNLVKTINPKIMTALVNDLPNGTYIVTAITKDSILSSKFIKQ